MPSDSHEAPYWLALFSDSDLPRIAAKRAVFEWCVGQANPLSSLFALVIQDGTQGCKVSICYARALYVRLGSAIP